MEGMISDAKGITFTTYPEDSKVPMSVRLKSGEVTNTTYYQTSICEAGRMLVAVAGNTMHLFLPYLISGRMDGEEFLNEISTAKYAVASFGLPSMVNDYCFELMFEDGSDTPFSIQLTRKYVLPFMTVAYNGRKDFTLKIYIDDDLSVTREMPLRVRYATSFPCCNAWNDAEYALNEHELQQVAALHMVRQLIADAAEDGVCLFDRIARFIRKCCNDYDWKIAKEVMYEAWSFMRNYKYQSLEAASCDNIERRLKELEMSY